MALDRKLWESHLTRFHAPRWFCPRCSKGHLVLQAESVFFRPSGAAYALLDEEPEDRGNDLELRFSAMLQCDYRGCQETATVSGVGQEKATHESGHRELYVVLFPRFISPSSHLFTLPAAIPAPVAKLIESAFALSWGDYEACLNRVRVCLELLLDGLHIPRSAQKAGRKNTLTLHRRVELRRQRYRLQNRISWQQSTSATLVVTTVNSRAPTHLIFSTYSKLSLLHSTESTRPSIALRRRL